MDIDALITAAEEALEEGDLDAAERAGKQLLNARHTYAFEVLATVHKERGDLSEALKVLEQGVAAAPQVWVLWLLLGHFASDAGDFPRAEQAYARALQCEGVDEDFAHLNIATLLGREGRHEEALAELDKLRGNEYTLQAAATRVRVLNALQRHDEAVGAAHRAFDALRDDDDAADLARVESGLALAYFHLGQLDDAREAAWDAIASHASDEDAMWLIRELEAKTSAKAKHFRILVTGQWHERVEEDDDEPPQFFVHYGVVADDEEEAMELIRRFEPEEVRASLVADEVEVAPEDVAEQPKGVYRRSGYAFYSGDDE